MFDIFQLMLRDQIDHLQTLNRLLSDQTRRLVDTVQSDDDTPLQPSGLAKTYAHSLRHHDLLHHRIQRHAHLAHVLAPSGAAYELDTWRELAELQRAAMQRWMTLQIDGMQQALVLFEERRQLRKANTVSKLAEQELNLLLQLSALSANQITATLELVENIENNLGYWAVQTYQPPTPPT